MLEELKASAASKGLSLQLDDEWLSILYFKDYVEVVVHYLFRVVHHAKIHLCAGLELADSGLYSEDVLLENLSFEGLILSGSSCVYPRLHFYLRVIGELETPVGLYAANILDGNSNTSGVFSFLGRNFSEIP